MKHKIKSVKEISVLIKKKRRGKKLTQSELAESCGLGRRFVSELENAFKNTSKKNRYDLNLTLRLLQRLGFEILASDKEESSS